MAIAQWKAKERKEHGLNTKSHVVWGRGPLELCDQFNLFLDLSLFIRKMGELKSRLVNYEVLRLYRKSGV